MGSNLPSIGGELERVSLLGSTRALLPHRVLLSAPPPSSSSSYPARRTPQAGAERKRCSAGSASPSRAGTAQTSGSSFTSSKAILGAPAPVADDLLMRPLAVRARSSRS